MTDFCFFQVRIHSRECTLLRAVHPYTLLLCKCLLRHLLTQTHPLHILRWLLHLCIHHVTVNSSQINPKPHLSADIPAQICASTSGAWPVASDVLSISWCSGVHAHAATHVCGPSGSECTYGLLPHGSGVPSGLHRDGGQRVWCWCSLHSRQQRQPPSEYPARNHSNFPSVL